ncbi:hypothetical protein T484DRAFT_2288480, partial [Baffinella frigidus]
MARGGKVPPESASPGLHQCEARCRTWLCGCSPVDEPAGRDVGSGTASRSVHEDPVSSRMRPNRLGSASEVGAISSGCRNGDPLEEIRWLPGGAMLPQERDVSVDAGRWREIGSSGMESGSAGRIQEDAGVFGATDCAPWSHDPSRRRTAAESPIMEFIRGVKARGAGRSGSKSIGEQSWRDALARGGDRSAGVVASLFAAVVALWLTFSTCVAACGGHLATCQSRLWDLVLSVPAEDGEKLRGWGDPSSPFLRQNGAAMLQLAGCVAAALTALVWIRGAQQASDRSRDLCGWGWQKRSGAGWRQAAFAAALALAWALHVGRVDAAMSVTAANTANFPAKAGMVDAITVYGQEFNAPTGNFSVRVGDTVCATTTWESETTIHCVPEVGVASFANLAIVVTADTVEQAGADLLSYDANSVSSTERGNTRARGGESISVTGSNFGVFSATPMARGDTACEATTWVSDSTVHCRAAGGVGRSRPLSATVGAGVGILTEAASYDGATLSGMGKSNAPGTGSTSVTVRGAGFGLVSYSGGGRAGETAFEGTEWESDSSVKCQVPAGSFRTRVVVLTVAEATGSVTEGLSFDARVLSTVHSGNRAGTGSTSVTVQGSNFGLTTYTEKARAGDTACE